MDTTAGPNVEVNFTLDIGSGRLDATAIVPAGETNLTQLLPVLQDLSSDIIGSAAQIASNEGYNVSCRAGCGACCRQLVPLTIFEAEFLADWVRTLPPKRQNELAARFNAALIKFRDSGLLARMDPSVRIPDGPEEKALAVDYLRQRVPCPFLENESCSIHPIRPLICREYLVTSPPENCVDPSVFPVVGVPIPLKLSHVLVEVGSHVDPASGGWMPLVFLFAWMNAGGGQPGKVVSGPGPELLHEIVKRLVRFSNADAAAKAS
jgi:Fe-S-cluster containining protein